MSLPTPYLTLCSESLVSLAQRQDIGKSYNSFAQDHAFMYVCAKQPHDFPQRDFLMESRPGSILSSIYHIPISPLDV